MSKPNLLGFTVSLGFFRNERIRKFRSLLLPKIPRKIPFAEIAPMLFQAAMAYCGENAVDGDLSKCDTELWSEIFRANNIQVTVPETILIRKFLDECGLTEGGKIRSWGKFNPHLVRHEKTIKDRRKAGKTWQKIRQMEAQKNAREKANFRAPEPDPKPEKNGSKNGDNSKELWFLDKAIAEAQEGSPDWKELRAQRRELLKSTLPKKPAAAAGARPAARPRKISKGEADQTLLMMARQLLANSPDMLEKRHFQALWAAGDDLPADVVNRFGGTVGKKEAEHNPVPG